MPVLASIFETDCNYVAVRLFVSATIRKWDLDATISVAIDGNMQAVGGLNPDASKWEVKDVSTWLGLRGLQEHAKVFVDNDVNGSLLLRLDKVNIQLHLLLLTKRIISLTESVF